MTALGRVAGTVCAALLLSACSSSPDPQQSSAPPVAAPPVTPAATSPAVALPSPVPSPASGPSTYLALGDSVAAGVGAATPGSGGYVPLLAGLLAQRLGCDAPPAPGCPLQVRNLAESGATTTTLTRRQLPQALELLRTSPDVRLVTLTVGGNDVFEPVVRACARAPQDPSCAAAVTSSVRQVDSRVDEVLRALAAALKPGTTLAVMAYYDPVPACRLAQLSRLTDRVLEGSGGQPGLNDVLRARAAQHGALVVETRERLTVPGSFVGNDDCLHPSGLGHARIAEAFLDVVARPVARR